MLGLFFWLHLGGGSRGWLRKKKRGSARTFSGTAAATGLQVNKLWWEEDQSQGNETQEHLPQIRVSVSEAVAESFQETDLNMDASVWAVVMRCWW